MYRALYLLRGGLPVRGRFSTEWAGFWRRGVRWFFKRIRECGPPCMTLIRTNLLFVRVFPQQACRAWMSPFSRQLSSTTRWSGSVVFRASCPCVSGTRVRPCLLRTFFRFIHGAYPWMLCDVVGPVWEPLSWRISAMVWKSHKTYEIKCQSYKR